MPESARRGRLTIHGGRYNHERYALTVTLPEGFHGLIETPPGKQISAPLEHFAPFALRVDYLR